MKKILCFFITILMMISLCSFSAIAVDDTELSQKFYDYCVDVLPEDMQPAEDDKVTINLEYEIDGVTFFSAENWVTEYTDVICKFGDTYVYTRAKRQPYELGIYASSGDEIYTLEEAYNFALITDVSVLEDAFCSWYLFYEDYVPNPENKYESDIVQKVFSQGSWSQDEFDITYKEVFEYFADTNASFDEATPNYALIYVRGPMVTDAPEAYMFGDYVLQSTSGYTPFSYGYCIYIPATGEVYDLVEAYEMGIDDIEKVFTETNIGRLLGDMDKDRKLTVKDATYIQKIHAGIEDFSDVEIYAGEFDETLPCAISDFNRDRATNIKDATAIQKYIAGITDDADEPEPAPFSSNIHQDAEYMDDCILVVVKKGLGYDYTLEDFPEYEFSSIEKIGGTDGKGYAIYVLYLENPGKENVVEAIKALDYRAETDLYAAEPDYIYYVWY